VNALWRAYTFIVTPRSYSSTTEDNSLELRFSGHLEQMQYGFKMANHTLFLDFLEFLKLYMRNITQAKPTTKFVPASIRGRVA